MPSLERLDYFYSFFLFLIKEIFFFSFKLDVDFSNIYYYRSCRLSHRPWGDIIVPTFICNWHYTILKSSLVDKLDHILRYIYLYILINEFSMIYIDNNLIHLLKLPYIMKIYTWLEVRYIRRHKFWH